MFTPSETEAPKMQKVEDLRGHDLKHYEVEIEAMNLILISILNDIYNSMDAYTTVKSMWKRVECLIRGTVQNQVDRETRFNNKFDQFVAEPREALVSVYNRFAQLINDLEQNHIIFPPVTVNTKFLSCLQPEWLKYVTQVRLAKRLTMDSYDDLFDYLQNFEKLVNASRAKKLEKTHDPLALVAHTGSSSRITTPYYVTHPSSVADYDDDYQGDTVPNNSDDALTSAMIFLAHAITRNYSNPTNNHLRASSNTRNQTIVQGDRVNIQSRNSGNNGRNTRHSYVQEEVIEETAANVQCYNCSEKGHYARNCPKPKVQDSNDFDVGPSYDFVFLSEVQTPSTGYVNPLFVKDNIDQKYPMQPNIINNIIGNDQIDSNIIFDEPNDDDNNSSFEDDNNAQQSYELEQLARNVYREAEK
ncbi:integrase, catalytic region, zinc finger, CCHC-type containing protein [Tanacetum coccineum]